MVALPARPSPERPDRTHHPVRHIAPGTDQGFRWLEALRGACSALAEISNGVTANGEAGKGFWVGPGRGQTGWAPGARDFEGPPGRDEDDVEGAPRRGRELVLRPREGVGDRDGAAADYREARRHLARAGVKPVAAHRGLMVRRRGPTGCSYSGGPPFGPAPDSRARKRLRDSRSGRRRGSPARFRGNARPPGASAAGEAAVGDDETLGLRFVTPRREPPPIRPG